MHKKTLISIMKRQPKLFQKSLLNFLTKLLTLDTEESHIKNFFRLLDKLYFDMAQTSLQPNGSLLLKSVIRHLVEICTLPKLHLKLQIRSAFMLA